MKKKVKYKDLTPARKFYRIISKVIDIVMIPVMVLAIFCCFVMFNAKRQNLVPNILGYSLVVPVSPSMVASGFEPGKTVLVRTANPKGLQVGDIIAYYRYTAANRGVNPYSYPVYVAPENESKYADLTFDLLIGNRNVEMQIAGAAQTDIIFHQIVDIRQDNNGTLWFKTKGTSNATADSWWVRGEYIVGVYDEVPPIIHSLVTFVGSVDGIIYLVIIPIAIIMFMLALEFIDNWDRYEMEQKLVKGEIYLTDKMCVKKNIGFDMTPKNKLIVLSRASVEDMQLYAKLMWKTKDMPKGLMKHILKQRWSSEEEQKLKETRQKAEIEYLAKKSPEIITEYQNAVKTHNELEYKLRGEYYTPNELTMSKTEKEILEKQEQEESLNRKQSKKILKDIKEENEEELKNIKNKAKNSSKSRKISK